MKRLFRELRLTLLLVAGFAIAHLSTGQTIESDVKTVAEKFVKSADYQDPDLLESVLYQDAKQFVMFGPQVMQSSASEYVAQIRDKKLGGKERAIEIQNVLLEGDNVAYVKLQAVGGGLTFSYQLTMFKLEDSWKIMTITTKAARS
ncbi:MAG: nuclear transport factor 2 family protein [Cyclobacteriaceae bacterium]